MGNCIIKESSTQWGGDDWGTSLARESDLTDDRTCSRYVETERTSLLGISSEGTKVKIRISKKQLSDLLRNADVQGFSAQEVLTQLVDAGDRFEAHRWSPALQTISES